MKKCFIQKRFNKDTLTVIEQANKIIGEYQNQGLRMTLRQLYYQFVSANYIANNDKSYKRLAHIISDARLAGLVDWDAIEDRGRVPSRPSEWDSVSSILRSAVYSYRKRRWSTQPRVVELWVEKQALAGVLEPLASEFHVTLSVNKGYSSSSAMYEAANRISAASVSNGRRKAKPAYVLYLGDHDPSGEDMVRDIDERLNLFRSPDMPCILVEKLALTRDQIDQYKPPPNPAKKTDTRYRAYEEEHGSESWELDALKPTTLQQIIRDRLNQLVDWDAMKAVISEENEEKAAMQELSDRFERSKQADGDDDEEDGDDSDEEQEDAHPIHWMQAHWTAFYYVAEIAAQDGSCKPDPKRLRCNELEHPEIAKRLREQADGEVPVLEGHDTETTVGTLYEHDDWSCLEDAEDAGLLSCDYRGSQKKYKLTPMGYRALKLIEEHLAEGLEVKDFRLKKLPL